MPINPQRRRLAPWIAAGALLIMLPGAITLLAESAHPAATRPAAKVAATKPASRPTTLSAVAHRKMHKEEEISRVMDFFRVTQPDVFEQAKTLRDSNPAQFEKLVRPVFPTVNRLEDMRKKNPKLFKLTMKDMELNYHSLRLAREIKRSDLIPPQRDKLIADLNGLVAEQFDVRLQIRQAEIDALTAQLAKLSATLQENQQEKDSKIKKRVDDLVEKTPKLNW